MYAIVKSGGKQYRVECGQQLLIERLPDDEGASVALEPLLYRSEEAIFERDGLERVKVTAKVLGHVRGEKLRVFKFKPKRGYKRRTGHRQELTRIEVTEITTGSAARTRRAKASDTHGERPEAKPSRTPAAKTTKAVPAAPAKAEAKAEETPSGKAKPAGAAEAKAAKTAEAKAAKTTEAEATDAGEAKTKETPKPSRSKKRPPAAKDSAGDAKATEGPAKAKKETGEDGT
jgi:large subunit ribosomal protein L21